MRCSHFIAAIPYQPGTIARSGNPCAGVRGSTVHFEKRAAHRPSLCLTERCARNGFFPPAAAARRSRRYPPLRGSLRRRRSSPRPAATVRLTTRRSTPRCRSRPVPTGLPSLSGRGKRGHCRRTRASPGSFSPAAPAIRHASSFARWSTAPSIFSRQVLQIHFRHRKVRTNVKLFVRRDEAVEQAERHLEVGRFLFANDHMGKKNMSSRAGRTTSQRRQR